MGLQIGEIIPRTEIDFEDIENKTIAIDAFNIIYQFLSTIRQPDGTPLMDSKGRISSHLSGLLYRNINLMTLGIKLVYVFDGKSPEEKAKTSELRAEIKKEAKRKYEIARKANDLEAMSRFSKQLTTLDKEKIKESKKLLDALGIPCIQAPGEGEAQASYMCKTDKNIYAVASQDYDALLFGSPRLIQNLTMARKRRLASGAFVSIQPELIELQRVLNSLQLTHNQLISLGILVGTDYNPGGIKGIGPKKALQLVRQYKQPALIFKQTFKMIKKAGKELEEEFDWQKIFELFKKPKTTKYKIKFKKVDSSKVKKILLSYEFSENRVDSALERLERAREKAQQSGLDKWF